MFMRTRFLRMSCAAVAAIAFFAGVALAQNKLDSRSTLHITLPEDSPVAVVSADWGESTASPRGGAMLLDLHTSLMLRNTGQRRIRGITLLVTSQEVTPGGKASVSVPSLNIAANESFPIRIDLRLLRPLQSGSGPLVQIGLDGILFDDLNFYGPDKLGSRRSMTVWELEARRDRKYFRALMERSGPDALRQEMLASLERQSARQDARVAQAGRSTAGSSGRQVQLAFLDMPDAPVEAQSGSAYVRNNEIRSPRMNVHNTSQRPVRAMEIGYSLKDSIGREYVAGAVPIELSLAPSQRTTVVQDAAFQFTTGSGQPIQIDSITAFLSSVEFADGNMWVPSRQRDMRMPTPSPEEQRLTDLYRKRGLQALVEELRKF